MFPADGVSLDDAAMGSRNATADDFREVLAAMRAGLIPAGATQYMHLVFKRELGCTPRAYRDRMLGERDMLAA